MSNNKQSSVEWFFNQLVANRIIVINGTTYWDKVKAKYEILLEQAKQIEQERMQEQYQDGREIGKIQIKAVLGMTDIMQDMAVCH